MGSQKKIVISPQNRLAASIRILIKVGSTICLRCIYNYRAVGLGFPWRSVAGYVREWETKRYGTRGVKTPRRIETLPSFDTHL